MAARPPELVVLALDVGSSWAKAAVYDEDARELGRSARRPVPIAADGTADAVVFADAVDAVVDDAVARLARPPDAVALTTSWHGIVGLDRDGRPVTRLSTWLDTRAADVVVDLASRVADVEALRARTGAPLHPSLPATRLWWLSRHEPEAFARASRWCSIPEWLATRWHGTVGPSPSMASGSGLYDQLADEWDGELVGALGLGAGSLSAVEREPRVGLRPDYAARWLALAEVPFFPAPGDGASALVGSGCVDGRRAAISVGTSAAVRVLLPRAAAQATAIPRPLFRYLLDESRSAVGAARSNAGNLVAWARRELRLAGADPVADATAGRAPGGHGLAVDPALAGERSPCWPPAARGRVEGLRLDTTALDLVQALVEAAAVGLAACVDELEGWTGGRLTLVASGGGASPGWLRLVADASGRDVVRCGVEEVAARGAAIVALERLGALASDASLPVDGEVVAPDPARAEAFARLRQEAVRAAT